MKSFTDQRSLYVGGALIGLGVGTMFGNPLPSVLVGIGAGIALGGLVGAFKK